MNKEQKIALFDQFMKLIEQSNKEEETEMPKFIGTLNKAQGIKGFKSAEIGTPVFEYRDRYILYLESLDGKTNLTVPYLKSTLGKVIDFSSTYK